MAYKPTIRPLNDDEDDTKEKKPDYQAQLLKLIHDAEERIAIINTEYNKYFTGAEKIPPIKHREELEKMIVQIKNLKKHAVGQGTIMKVQNILNSHLSYKTLWDKKLADVENGKIKIPKKS